MTGPDNCGGLPEVQGPGSPCDRCRQTNRLVYSPAPAGRGRWLCPNCLADLDALWAGKAVPAEKGERTAPGVEEPGFGAAAGCAVAFCLFLVWLVIGFAAFLHGH